MSNVSSVDLDELRKAREELNQEIGVENDPNMYKDYNPNREEESKKESVPETFVEESVPQETISESTENNEENITSNSNDANFSDENDNEEPESSMPSKEEVLDMLLDDSDPVEEPVEDNSSVETSSEEKPAESHSSSEENLGKFDMFAAFEVKENAVSKPQTSELEDIISSETTTERTTNLEKLERELETDNLGEKTEDISEHFETNEPVKFEVIDNLVDLENVLNGFLDDLEKDDEVYENSAESSASDEESTLAGFDIEPTIEDLQDSSEEVNQEDVENSLLAKFDNTDEEDVNPLDEDPDDEDMPYRKDVLGAMMGRTTENSNSTDEETVDESDDETEQETDESEMNFNLDNFEINVDSNLQEALNEPDEEFDSFVKENEETVEDAVEESSEPETKSDSDDFGSKFGSFEINVDGANTDSEDTETLENNEEHEEIVSSDGQETELEEGLEESELTDSEENDKENSEESAESSEESAETSEEAEEEKKEEILDVGVDDINRILGINEEEKPKKQEFVESTEYYDPSKARKKETLENTHFEEPEIITDYSQLREILQRELKESELAEQEKMEEEVVQEVVEEPKVKFPLIEEFKFINEIATDEFKNSNKFSYIMGKNEKGDMVYGNFREHHNLAVFSRNEIVTKSFLNSMILSLCLKNSNYDVNFVLIDSNINSSFEVYNKSSYLFFNRIAKTNKEILDTLIEISKELDARYEKLASAGMGSIDQYNEMTSETQTTPMPNLVIVFNNYTDVSQATYADKINACLYQILKFGRIVGIYMVLTAMVPIETNQVNYNLSSRLSFKSDQNSKYTVGVEDVEFLPDEADAIYFNISKNSAEHIKATTITDSELDLIIKELED